MSFPEFAAKVEELRWKKLPVLNDGFVTLVDVMGDESAVVQAARVSYGTDARKFDSDLGDPDDMTADQIDSAVKQTDLRLMRYLMRHRHTTPLEMVEIKLLVRVPMDCWRQWIRHRTASVNEYSTRYAEAIDEKQTTPPDKWRLQAEKNKQGSSGFLEDNAVAQLLTVREKQLHGLATTVYRERLGVGIAREQARKDLPLSTYTEAYWKIDLHNLLHFLGLRLDSHAQVEIREYSQAIAKIVAELYPNIWEAFNDYSPLRGAILLTRLEVETVKKIWHYDEGCEHVGELAWEEQTRAVLKDIFTNKRECQECIEKLIRLELFPAHFQMA